MSVYLNRLLIENFRCLPLVDWQPIAGVNILTGPNGIGKTSFLESVHFLSSGKSFRAGGIHSLIRHGQSMVSVYGEILKNGNAHCLGLSKDKTGQMKARLQGHPLAGVSPLSLLLPVVSIHSDSYYLIDLGPEFKRRFLDWLTFHVKPSHLLTWKKYRKILLQANALLKQKEVKREQRHFWYEQLAEVGEALSENRATVFSSLKTAFQTRLEMMQLEALQVDIEYRRGWRQGEPLFDAFCESDSRNIRYGVVSIGPHRMDMLIRSHCEEAKKILSRGQKKIVAMALYLSQLEVIHSLTSQWPVICLDDVDSELDKQRLEFVIEAFSEIKTQVFVSSLHPETLKNLFCRNNETSVFHVEQDMGVSF